MGQALSAFLLQQQHPNYYNGNNYNHPHQRFFTVGTNTQLYLRDSRLDQLSCFRPNRSRGRFEPIVRHIVPGLSFRVHSLVDRAPIDVHVDNGSPVQEHHTLIRLQMEDEQEAVTDGIEALFVDQHTLVHVFTPFPPDDPRRLTAPESWGWHHSPEIRHQEGRRLLPSVNGEYLSDIRSRNNNDGEDDDDTESLYSTDSRSRQGAKRRFG